MATADTIALEVTQRLVLAREEVRRLEAVEAALNGKTFASRPNVGPRKVTTARKAKPKTKPQPKAKTAVEPEAKPE